MKVGLIGTGMMGAAIAKRLLETGHTLMVYNRTREKAERLKQFGASVADSPKQVAESSDLILTVVKDAEAVEQICFMENGIVEGRHRDLVLADVSTINPLSSRRLASRLREYEIVMLDSPVMGGPQLAENGELIVMIAGSMEYYRRYEEIFKSLGRIFYLGDNGSAHAMKLSLNLQIAMIALALSEGITLAKGLGIDPEKFLEILNATYFKTGMSERKGPKMIKHNFEASFTLKMMLKDLSTINDAAKASNLTLLMSSTAEQLYRAAVNSNYGELDYTGILAFIEKISGIKE